MKKIILLVVTIVALAGLFYALKHNFGPSHTNPSTPAAPKIRSFSLEIQNDEVVKGDKTLSVKQGDKLRISLTSDIPGELHLHGYDKEVALTPGQPSMLAFTADTTGRFEAELHGTEKAVFVLEVQP